MRVEYTIPGTGPGFEPAAANAEEDPGLFRAFLGRLTAPQYAKWPSLLRLDLAPAGAATIGSPPPPRDFEPPPSAAQRLEWRRMLDRHRGLLEMPLHGHIDSGDASVISAAQRMLALLYKYRELEDAVASRCAAEARE